MYLSQVFEFHSGHTSGRQTSLMSLGKLFTVLQCQRSKRPFACKDFLSSIHWTWDVPPEVVPVSPWEVVGISKTLELERWRFDPEARFQGPISRREHENFYAFPVCASRVLFEHHQKP